RSFASSDFKRLKRAGRDPGRIFPIRPKMPASPAKPLCSYCRMLTCDRLDNSVFAFSMAGLLPEISTSSIVMASASEGERGYYTHAEAVVYVISLSVGFVDHFRQVFHVKSTDVSASGTL